tara:strand:- start:1945 stop:2229 length:285 start_codon:yes stop_codon:yes gene_type:complete
MRTQVILDLHHRKTIDAYRLRKTFDCVILPPLQTEQLNFSIAVEYGEGTIDAEVQSVQWMPDEDMLYVLTKYIYFETLEELDVAAHGLDGRGWL